MNSFIFVNGIKGFFVSNQELFFLVVLLIFFIFSQAYCFQKTLQDKTAPQF